ncbi:unnamed protein product [Brassicogethes aeneus]|uniref:MADF domain-containing protein n=1 Tax=Brassicogethes aeneus TaxID=1431903 RepID=A0A9P0B1P8_BRAAE|nr:unnamed protein product [Brassicogethes aeneus]
MSLEIINFVKSHPILYDTTNPDYRKIREREKVWEVLAKDTFESVDKVKKKWKNLRDCYHRYLKTLHGINDINSSRPGPMTFKWANKMEFCKPFLEMNIEKAEEVSSKSDNSNYSEESTFNFTINNTKKRKRSDNDSFGNLFHNTLDATDLIFLGYSHTIKTFSPTRQINLKLKIAQIIMEEELKQLEETGMADLAPCPIVKEEYEEPCNI